MTSSLLTSVLEEVEICEENLQEENTSNKVEADLQPLIQEIYTIDNEYKESCIEHPNHLQVWKELEAEFETKRKAIQEYQTSKQLKPDVPINPDLDYLNKNVFPLLLTALEETLIKAKKLDCLKHQKNRFNGIDYIAEILWNLNPKHPERHKKRIYIFDIKWVKDWLNRNPRPFYPFSYVWSTEFAATKIQAYVRGYWVRRTDAVQEMRQFWKVLAAEKEFKTKSLENLEQPNNLFECNKNTSI